MMIAMPRRMISGAAGLELVGARADQPEAGLCGKAEDDHAGEHGDDHLDVVADELAHGTVRRGGGGVCGGGHGHSVVAVRRSGIR
jgi:hypothetical protein